MIHALNPIALEWGGLILSWYWLAYLAGFLWVSMFGLKLLPLSTLEGKEFISFMQWGFLCMIASSRLFFVLVYHPQFFWNHPSMIPQFWLGGMSFHGALIGPAVLAYFMSRKAHRSFFHYTDLVLISVPVALFCGRIANFINGELYGRPSNVAWAMVFPLAQDGLTRHPSQLYQALSEGLLLGIILFTQRKRLARPGEISCLFVGLYGLFRFLTEFTREPDQQLGTWLGLSLGQYLCLAMMIIALFVRRGLKKSNLACGTRPQ